MNFPIFLTFAAVTLAGCRSYDLHSKLTDAELGQRLHTHFHPGMPQAEFRATLDTLKVSHGPALWRAEPPAYFVRLYPPGGAWPDQAGNTLEWVDVTFAFTPDWSLTGWAFTRDQLRYVGTMPYEWDAADGPPRRWPLQPLPPREWRGPGISETPPTP